MWFKISSKLAEVLRACPDGNIMKPLERGRGEGKRAEEGRESGRERANVCKKPYQLFNKFYLFHLAKFSLSNYSNTNTHARARTQAHTNKLNTKNKGKQRKHTSQKTNKNRIDRLNYLSKVSPWPFDTVTLEGMPSGYLL